MMRRAILIMIGSALLLGAMICAASAYPPNDWEVVIGASEAGGNGIMIGTIEQTAIEDSYSAVPVYPDFSGVYLREYMQDVPRYQDDTHLYGFAYRTPIPSGENKTWSDIYMWAQGYTPPTPYRVQVHIGPGYWNRRPVGYWGHLVLDYVPAECAWNGNEDFWVRLGGENHITLPIITTSDPFQGTRFHLTVYAPEPSSLLALAAGLGGTLGLSKGRAMRRRRRGAASRPGC